MYGQLNNKKNRSYGRSLDRVRNCQAANNLKKMKSTELIHKLNHATKTYVALYIPLLHDNNLD